MEGDVSWQGVSGVPGLGCSVENCYKYSSALKLWEKESDELEKKNEEEKVSISDKIVKFFSFRRKKNDQQTVSSSKYSSVSLPKVSVRRSVSAVTTSNRTKVKHRSSDENSQNLIIPSSKSNIRRSVSLQREKKKEREREQETCVRKNSIESHKKLLRRSETVNFEKNSPNVNFLRLPPNDQKSAHQKLFRSSQTKQQQCKNDTLKKCQATQTDISDELKEEKDYDYVYSNSISPAMLIKLSENLEENEEGDENIYEEIIPEDREMTRYNSLFLSISQGRREQLEMYRFLGWELDMEINNGDKMVKDNYIKPQAIKAELDKKILLQNTSLGRKKTKENKNVTFAADDGKLQRTKSVNVNSHRLLHSYV